MDTTTQNTKKRKIIAGIIKWIIIIGLFAVAIYFNRDFVGKAIAQIKKTPQYVLLICTGIGILFFLVEGAVIAMFSRADGKGLTIAQGITCAFLCAFYKLATLGSANGIAQIIYFKLHGIGVAKATGIGLCQYTVQKIVVGLMGIVSFCVLMLLGSECTKYAGYMLLGTIVISVICVVLFLVTVSKKISSFLMKIGYSLAGRFFKPENSIHNKLQKAEESIGYLQEQGAIIWKDKKLLLSMLLLDIFKFTLWYSIPGIIFSHSFDVSIPVCICLMAVVNMIGGVMVAPGGVGTLEFVFAVFFSAIIPSAKAIAATIILYRFFTWIMPAVLGILPALLVKDTGGE